MNVVRTALAVLLLTTAAHAQSDTCQEANAGQPVGSEESVTVMDTATSDDVDGATCAFSSPTILTAPDRFYRILLNDECPDLRYRVRAIPSEPDQDVAVMNFALGCDLCDLYRNVTGPGVNEVLEITIADADNSRVIGVESSTSDPFDVRIETVLPGCTLSVELLEIEVR